MAKSAQEVAQKWASRASNAQPEYASGVQTTTKDQAGRAIASKEIYKQALNESFARDAYSKGLQKAGTAKWKQKASSVGAERYSSGVSVSVTDYATESGKYDNARKAADALPRGIKGSETNLSRVKAVVSALRVAKVGAK